MKRKIVKQGAATMTISLPSSWIKKNKLQSGDEIDLIEEYNTIVINTDNAKTGQKYVFDASTKKVMTPRTIVGAYTLGYDEIEIRFTDPAIFKKVQETTQELIGFEIINQTNSKCILKELTGITEKEFNPIFRRFFRIICEIFDEGLEAIHKKDITSIENLILRDKDVNKFGNLCVRYLNKVGADNPELTTTYIVMCHTLEEISDHFKEILKLAKDNKISKNETETLSELINLSRNMYEFTFKLDETIALSASESYEKINDILAKEKSFNPLIHSLLSSLNTRIITLLGMQAPFSK